MASVGWQVAGTLIDFVLYDAADVVLATVSPDRDNHLAAGNAKPFFYRLVTGITIKADTFYRLAVKPTTTNDANWRVQEVRAAASMDLIDGGQNFHLSTRTDAGAWTDVLTKRPMLYLMFDEFDGAPSGGSGFNPVSLLGGRSGGKQ